MNKYTVLITSLIISFTINPANALLIDDFTDGTMHVEADNLGVFENATSAFGGGRTISIKKQGQGAKADVIASYGLYAHSTDANTSATSTINWSSTTEIDLVENTNNNVFSLDIFNIDQGKVDFILSITDKATHTDKYTLLGAGVGINDIYFTSFSGIDFHHITNISLQIEGGLESDIVLNSLSTERKYISAVPTPAALVLFSTSLVILSLSRRKLNN